MQYKNFSKIVLSIKKASENSSKAHKIGIDLFDFNDDLNSAIHILLEEVYGKDGAEWFYWFCYESDFGDKDWSRGDTYKKEKDGTVRKMEEQEKSKYGAHDENGNPICHSIKSTWEYLEKNHRVVK